MRPRAGLVFASSLLGLVGLGPLACADPSAAPANASRWRDLPAVTITAVRLEVTNPSIAPQHRVDRTWTLAASEPGVDAALTKLLDQTRINEQASVGEYVRLIAAERRAEVASIDARAPRPVDRGEGGSRASLTLVTAERGPIELPLDASYSSAALTELRELVVAQGSLVETSGELRPLDAGD